MKIDPNTLKPKRSGPRVDERILQYADELSEAGAVGINLADLPPGRTDQYMSPLSVRAAMQRELRRRGLTGKLTMYTIEKHPDVCNEHKCDIIIARH